MDGAILREVAFALGVGALIGLERSLGALFDAKNVSDNEIGGGNLSQHPLVRMSRRPPSMKAPPPPADLAPSEEPAEDEGAEAASAEEPSAAVVGGEEEGTAAAEPPEKDEEIGDTLGLRTFASLSLMGYAGAVAADRAPFLAPMVMLGAILLVLGMYFRNTEVGVGITTEVAAIATCALGILCHHDPQLAGVLALTLTVVLSSKRFTYETLRKARRVELTDTLKFLVIIMIVLPLLPNRALDPYNAFNPYKVGVLVVLISGISYAGYFLTRVLGAQKGLGLTGVVGGLTSSTAVTAAMSQQARDQPELRAICAFSTIVANATMFVRVVVVVAVLDVALAKQLAWSIGGMGATALIASVILWFSASKSGKQDGVTKDGKKTKEVPLKNPFSLGPALKFAAFFVFILFVLKLAKIYLGDQGLYIASAVSGLADVDAITLSVSESARDGDMDRKIGAIAITIAVVSNSATKTGIAISTGGWKFGRLVALTLGLATVVGLAIAFIA